MCKARVRPQPTTVSPITATARTLDVAPIATLSGCDDGEIARPCYFRTWATQVRGGDQHDLGRDVGGARGDGKESQGRAS